MTITNANITGLDFVGTFVPFSISGHVKDNNGNPLVGFRILMVRQARRGAQRSPMQMVFMLLQTLPGVRAYSVNPDSGRLTISFRHQKCF